MGDNGQEPLLAYRMIYDIRDANEMAAKLNKSSMEEPLEYYEMMAPINRQLLIGPKYPFYSGRVYGGSVDYDIRFESNYYISINNNISTSLKRVTYKESSSSYDEFTWFSPEESAETIAISSTYCMNNNDIRNKKVNNGLIIAVEEVGTGGHIRTG